MIDFINIYIFEPLYYQICLFNVILFFILCVVLLNAFLMQCTVSY